MGNIDIKYGNRNTPVKVTTVCDFQSDIVSNDFVIKTNLAFRAITPTNFPSSEGTTLLHNFN